MGPSTPPGITSEPPSLVAAKDRFKWDLLGGNRIDRRTAMFARKSLAESMARKEQQSHGDAANLPRPMPKYRKIKPGSIRVDRI